MVLATVHVRQVFDLLTGVKFRFLEALVPPFESSRRDLHDRHGFSDFLMCPFLGLMCNFHDFVEGAASKGIAQHRISTFFNIFYFFKHGPGNVQNDVF